MEFERNENKNDSVYSVRVKAGKRRTYFFDVRATRANDFFLTITESRKRGIDDGYDRHKIFLYKEDFNKFVAGLNEAVSYVKTDLMPDFDFDTFDRPYEEPDNQDGAAQATAIPLKAGGSNGDFEATTPIANSFASNAPGSGVLSTVVSTNHQDVEKW
ncbi:MAG: DUF3276 family protein [Bacteroidetes bacterium]|nr:MAG: DUF3276 family protein [Bacteroidota bacterium]